MLKLGRTSLAFAVAIAFTGASALGAAPALAQEQAQASAEEVDVYADLVEAMFEASDREAELDNALSAIRRQFIADPSFAELERESPGYVDDIIEAMRPILGEIAANSEVNLRREYVRLFSENLTSEEAIELTDLYRDPVFQQILRRMSQSFTPDAMMEDLDSKAPIERDDLVEDVTRAAAAAVSEASPQEIIRMNQRIQNSQAWSAFQEIQPVLIDTRLKIENSPLTPAEDRALMEAIEQVQEKHFPL